MGDEPVIRVENVTKTFRLYHSPFERVKEAFHPRRKTYHEEFVALRDVSFTVRRGEAVAIMGRNGSGKSTLLQIVAGVLQPTHGTAVVHGRLSALLELGTGFNPEFTGRQNVYLSASILGFQRAEVDRRFDEIERFAEIGEFIDQPVKTYSSGMYVRLAFSLAIATDPEIMIVDEALSVGDEAFQRKCFGRIRDFLERGGTLLFVTHAAQTVVDICNRALLVDHGTLLLDNDPKPVVTTYHKLIYAAGRRGRPPADRADGRPPTGGGGDGQTFRRRQRRRRRALGCRAGDREPARVPDVRRGDQGRRSHRRARRTGSMSCSAARATHCATRSSSTRPWSACGLAA